MSIVTQRIYTGDSIVYVGENGGGGGGGGVWNSHTISNPGGSNTVVGPFTATSNSGNHGTAHHSLFDANGNSIGYPVPEMPGGPRYVLSADDYGGMAWALFASKIQAALSSSDGSVTFTPTGSGSDVTVNVKVVHDATLTGDGTAASSLSAVLGLWPTISFTSGSLAISHGIFYIGTDIANLTLSLNAVTSGAEYHLKFTTSSTIGTFDFSAVTSWIGNSPSISASTTYEIDILDGVGIIATVG